MMGLLENAVEGVFEGPGLLVGLGAVVAAPVVFPTVAGGLRPVAKGIIRGGLALSEVVRGTFAEASERFSDLVAEVREERGAAAPAAVAAAKPPSLEKPEASATRQPPRPRKRKEPAAQAPPEMPKVTEEKPPTA
jgi:hypothetical protein